MKGASYKSKRGETIYKVPVADSDRALKGLLDVPTFLKSVPLCPAEQVTLFSGEHGDVGAKYLLTLTGGATATARETGKDLSPEDKENIERSNVTLSVEEVKADGVVFILTNRSIKGCSLDYTEQRIEALVTENAQGRSTCRVVVHGPSPTEKAAMCLGLTCRSLPCCVPLIVVCLPITLRLQYAFERKLLSKLYVYLNMSNEASGDASQGLNISI